MKRQQFRATLWQVNELVSEDVAYAHNSGVRKSEALVRDFARSHGVIMHGGKPRRDETGYARIWKSADGSLEVVASVIPA